MKKYLLLALAAAAVVAAPSFARAEDAAAPAAADAAATTDATAPAADAAAAAEVKELTLKDGTKVHVKGEDVFVVGADGTETPAPDGTWEVNDGTTVVTVGGKVAPAAKADDKSAE